ncbi:sphingomyelin phosphodiesterase 1-like [Anopheles albimanus]|uniref:sphingomyelin phosphodiesterase 1-like n=1 Tax=Anopheles albimanus TaxID=7167 RepID=UPI00164007EF|nr:sphingomyelin phosphodiesterase 1-like [Anopheles albimanus]
MGTMAQLLALVAGVLTLAGASVQSTTNGSPRGAPYRIDLAQYNQALLPRIRPLIEAPEDPREEEIVPFFELLPDYRQRLSGNFLIDGFTRTRDTGRCLLCMSTSYLFLSLYNETVALTDGRTERLRTIAGRLCRLLGFKAYLCDGVIGLNGDIIQYVLEHRQPFPEPADICQVYLQELDCVGDERNVSAPDAYRTIAITPPIQRQLSHGNSFVAKAAADKEAGGATEGQCPRRKGGKHRDGSRGAQPPIRDPLTIVHLTDIHYDPEYVVGVNADCKAEACCRVLPDLPPANGTADGAGYWGDYRDCDTPWHAVVDMMEHIRTQHEHIDAIYFTGDIVHHFTWNTTIETNEQAMRQVFDLMKHTFPGVPIYPILGNHESHPANLYAPHTVTEALRTNYLYDYIVEQWADWLPMTGRTRETLTEGGYYTVRTPYGLRIIGLNNNPCFVHNFWLFYSLDYFLPQLQWLHDTLLEAEHANERVHILAHVPSYDDYCFVGWTREYRKIVERFAHIITAQFNGHSHVDEFNLYYPRASVDPLRPISVAWNGGSTTTFTKLNPNYKVFLFDPVSFEPIEQDTWMYNLTSANEAPDRRPEWFRAYSFKEYYQLPDLSLDSLGWLVQRFAQSEEQLASYWRAKQKWADPLMQEGCTGTCLREALCAIVRTEHDDNRICEALYQPPPEVQSVVNGA